jgi:hypothetical protein
MLQTILTILSGPLRKYRCSAGHEFFIHTRNPSTYQYCLGDDERCRNVARLQNNELRRPVAQEPHFR